MTLVRIWSLLLCPSALPSSAPLSPARNVSSSAGSSWFTRSCRQHVASQCPEGQPLWPARRGSGELSWEEGRHGSPLPPTPEARQPLQRRQLLSLSLSVAFCPPPPPALVLDSVLGAEWMLTLRGFPNQCLLTPAPLGPVTEVNG